MESFIQVLKIPIDSCDFIKEISNKCKIFDINNEKNQMRNIIKLRDECLNYMLSQQIVYSERELKINLAGLINIINKQKYVKKLNDIKNKKYNNEDSYKTIYDIHIYINKMTNISDDIRNNIFNCLRIIFLVENLTISK